MSWERHGAGVIEKVRRTDPTGYLRTVASLVRLTPNTEPDHNPLLDMTAEDLGAEILADFRNLFPEYDLAQLRRLARREAAKSLIFRGRTSKGLHFDPLLILMEDRTDERKRGDRRGLVVARCDPTTVLDLIETKLRAR